jgi:hypothetical protein
MCPEDGCFIDNLFSCITSHAFKENDGSETKTSRCCKFRDFMVERYLRVEFKEDLEGDLKCTNLNMFKVSPSRFRKMKDNRYFTL